MRRLLVAAAVALVAAAARYALPGGRRLGRVRVTGGEAGYCVVGAGPGGLQVRIFVMLYATPAFVL